VTFRTRIVLVATSAVLVVVVIGSLATYVVAYFSLVGSLDVTLQQDARNLVAGNQINQLPIIQNTCGRAEGYCSQMVWADGQVNTNDPQVLPIPSSVAQLAGSLGTGQVLLFTTKVGDISVREIVYPLAGPYAYSNGSRPIRRVPGRASARSRRSGGTHRRRSRRARERHPDSDPEARSGPS